jgi:hypothetical protein
MTRYFSHVLIGVALVAMLCGATPAFAQPPANLGTTQTYAVLAGSAITNTGPTVLNGDLGIHPNGAGSVTGSPVVNGASHFADAAALQAKNDLVVAYDSVSPPGCNQSFGVPTDIGGLVLTPGVYCFATSAAITGTLTLNFQGNPDAVFIFRTGSTLITAAGSAVVMINGGGQGCNVFWQVGSSATLGTTTTFVGTIMALTSITLNTGATIQGRALARNGAVTLDTNVITRTTCAGAAPTPSNPLCTYFINLSPSSLPLGVVGVRYEQQIRAGNGLAADLPYTFSKSSSGPLPTGLSLSTAGVLAGTPTTTGTYDFTIRATDTNGCFGEITYALSSLVTVPTLPQAFMLILAAGLMAAGYLRMQRRRRGESLTPDVPGSE